ncbi:mannitol dehydrogenase family protein [Saccharospirillum sp.]|uniref:mannitol dehydrogenase family protein n=1 Tax=Saccharospirillum sp. TaxID=2033801 RepID=UPI00349FF399
MKVTYIESNIDSRDHDIGIVHIGLGAFHRAHQAVYLEKTLKEHDGDWMIFAANIRSNSQLVQQLEQASHRYHVVEYSDSTDATVREIRAIKSSIYCGDDVERARLVAQMAEPSTRIITLTVTEKGYYLSPSTGNLLLEHADIQHDLLYPGRPKSALGLILAALKRRRSDGTKPFTVLSCDNMPHNGNRTKRAVISLAEANDPDMAMWIKEHVSFPNSMVDRIVPAATGDDLESIYVDTGIDDPSVVKCEAFSEWVVEDDFPAGRPQLESSGVLMVQDVSLYESRKLRMLNGSHSLLAYLGLHAGHKTVAQAMRDPDIPKFLQRYMLEEVAPTLPDFSKLELQKYCKRLLVRFENSSLQHQLKQIAMDGSQKLPQRWLEGLVELQSISRKAPAIELGIAGWISFISRAQANHEIIDDPLGSSLAELVRSNSASSADLVAACLDLKEIFPKSLSVQTDFVDRLITLVDCLRSGTPVQQMMNEYPGNLVS